MERKFIVQSNFSSGRTISKIAQKNFFIKQTFLTIILKFINMIISGRALTHTPTHTFMAGNGLFYSN